jgi:PTH1 family peptidyl-tRNA hydrolase
MKLVVGLGNPGEQYAPTRHNVGWQVLEKYDLRWQEKRAWQAAVARSGETLFVRPLTFMNESGRAVRAVLDYYKLSPADLVLVYDDKDLPFGTIRLRSGGSAGGHNGVQSVIDHLGSADFARVRLGIEPAVGVADTAQFVLQRFSATEAKDLPKLLEAAKGAIEEILQHGLDKTSHRDLQPLSESST